MHLKVRLIEYTNFKDYRENEKSYANVEKITEP